MSLLPRTLRVFEHARLVVGQRYRDTAGDLVEFTAAHFDAMVRFNDRNAERFFSVRHRAIQLSQYVGLVQIGRLGIEILPKADRGSSDEDRARWHEALVWMLATTRHLRLHSATESALALRRASLFDLYVEMFLRHVEELVRQGLARRYRTVRANSTAFRGRLLVAENIRHNVTHGERFYVEHQTYDESHLINQILKAAVLVLAAFSTSTRFESRVGSLLGELESISSRRFERELLHTVVLDRLTERYRPALILARLILLHYCPDLRTGRDPLVALLFDMNVLFEEFVGRMVLSASIPGVTVHLQESRPFWPAGATRRRTMRPDIVVRAGERSLVIDTKWKVPGSAGPAEDDLRQMYVYNRYFEAANSVLVYPSGAAGATDAHGGMFIGEPHGCSLAFIELFTEGCFSRHHVRQQLRRLVHTHLR